MSLAEHAEYITIETRNGPRKFGLLSMRDCANIRANYWKAPQPRSFYDFYLWMRGEPEGQLAVVVESGAKYDPVYNEEQSLHDFNTRQYLDAASKIVEASIPTTKDTEGSADPNAGRPAATPTG